MSALSCVVVVFMCTFNSMLLGFRFLMSRSCGDCLPSKPTSACFLNVGRCWFLTWDFGLEVVGFREGEGQRQFRFIWLLKKKSVTSKGQQAYFVSITLETLMHANDLINFHGNMCSHTYTFHFFFLK